MQENYVVRNNEDFNFLLNTIEIYKKTDSNNSFLVEIQKYPSLDYEELWEDFVKKMPNFDITIENISIDNQIILITNYIINRQETKKFLTKNLLEEKKFFQLVVKNENASTLIILMSIALGYYDIILKIIKNADIKQFNRMNIKTIESTLINLILLEQGIGLESVREFMEQRILQSVLNNDYSFLEIMTEVNPKLIETFKAFIVTLKQ